MAVVMLAMLVVVFGLGHGDGSRDHGGNRVLGSRPGMEVLCAAWLCWVCCCARSLWCRRGYRLGRVIAYVDPDYSKIEMIDTHHWIRDYVQQLH